MSAFDSENLTQRLLGSCKLSFDALRRSTTVANMWYESLGASGIGVAGLESGMVVKVQPLAQIGFRTHQVMFIATMRCIPS